MRTPEYSTQFRRDAKRAEKRGKNMGKLKALLSLLGYKDHPLRQSWLGYREAYIEPGWVVI